MAKQTSTVAKRGPAKAVTVGAPSKTGVDAHVEAEVLAEDAFPQDRVVVNNTRSKLVFPSVGAIVKPFGGFEVVTFRDETHLKNFVTDAEQLCELHGSVDGIVIKSVEQHEADQAAAAEKAAARAAEAAKATKADNAAGDGK